MFLQGDSHDAAATRSFWAEQLKRAKKPGGILPHGPFSIKHEFKLGYTNAY